MAEQLRYPGLPDVKPDLEADPPDCCCDMCYCRGCTPCLDRIALTQWLSGWRPPLWHENPVMELEWGRCQ